MRNSKFNRPWSPEEIALLLKLKAEGLSHRLISIQIGRSVDAVGEKWRWEQMSPEERRQRYSRPKRKQTTEDIQQRAVGKSLPSEELIADALVRATAPRSITAALFGDPPPGYSALDRRA